MDWLYEGQTFKDWNSYYGFVYKITHVPTGKKYIGRKYFTLASYKQVNGKRKKIRKESDWQEYWGSSKHLQSDITIYGKEQFKREIIRLCKSRTECSYFETKAIFEEDALLSKEYYNAWVSCKITEMHIKSINKDVH
jgi:hypothetical protein